ncbi:MAG: Phosphatidylserine decarboxylase proenzyme [Alphaproteobacteria bacterium]|nr:Phosphatidylserine decarboxylase proenzyme [Alphaproteobacteria bacterium]
MLNNPDQFKSDAGELGNRLVRAAKWLWATVPPLHPAGWPFVAAFALATVILGIFWDGFLVIGTILTLWCAFFFRNPPRVTPLRPGVVIAPADGLVLKVEPGSLPLELDQGDALVSYNKISIFLNVFDVHVQRAPMAGKILEVVYRPGKFVNAAFDKASEDNERSTVLMETVTGHKIAFVQIAGLIARRIINTLQKDQFVTAGELYGLIRFGSRVDLYLPVEMEPLVSVGQRTVGGETVLAQLKTLPTASVATSDAGVTL